jgi:hypothetical protein
MTRSEWLKRNGNFIPDSGFMMRKVGDQFIYIISLVNMLDFPNQLKKKCRGWFFSPTHCFANPSFLFIVCVSHAFICAQVYYCDKQQGVLMTQKEAEKDPMQDSAMMMDMMKGNMTMCANLGLILVVFLFVYIDSFLFFSSSSSR